MLSLVLFGGVFVAPPAAAGPSGSAAGGQAEEAPFAPSVAAEVLDLNTATAAQLAALPGLGPKRAEAIVAARAQHPFTRVTQLLRIRGIGPRMLRRLKGHVMVAPATGRSASRSASPQAAGR